METVDNVAEKQTDTCIAEHTAFMWQGQSSSMSACSHACVVDLLTLEFVMQTPLVQLSFPLNVWVHRVGESLPLSFGYQP